MQNAGWLQAGEDNFVFLAGHAVKSKVFGYIAQAKNEGRKSK